MWRRASPPWHGTPDWKIGCFAPPGLPPIRTLDDIQGRARSLLGQEHNPERAVTRIDEPNPAHDHCGELRRPNTTLGRQAEVIRNASNRHSVRSPALGM